MNKTILNKSKVLKVQIKVLTGLHIGGSKDSYGIGNVDNPVIKNPLNGQPIIPGSSIKGKLRGLLELSGLRDSGLFEPINNAPTRGIFRDFSLTEESKSYLEDQLGFGIFTELKTEVKIDQNTGKALNKGLRTIERVPAGVVFEGEIIVNAYNNDNLEELLSQLKKGFELLKMNYLGGNGTRGYGKVDVYIIEER